MSSKYLIDSSAFIEYLESTLKGIKIKKIIEEDEIFISAITISEIADKCIRNNQDFMPALDFVRSRAVILPVTADIALHAAIIKNEQRKKCPKFGIADAIQLATAKDENITIISADSDFKYAENIFLI